MTAVDRFLPLCLPELVKPIAQQIRALNAACLLNPSFSRVCSGLFVSSWLLLSLSIAGVGFGECSSFAGRWEFLIAVGLRIALFSGTFADFIFVVFPLSSWDFLIPEFGLSLKLILGNRRS